MRPLTLPFRSVLGICVIVVLVVATLEWITLGWPIGRPLLVAAIFAGLWRAQPRWPRVAAVAVLPFCLAAPTGAWGAYLRGEHDVVLVPIFDTVFAGWLLTSAFVALRQRGPAKTDREPHTSMGSQ